MQIPTGRPGRGTGTKFLSNRLPGEVDVSSPGLSRHPPTEDLGGRMKGRGRRAQHPTMSSVNRTYCAVMIVIITSVDGALAIYRAQPQVLYP